MMAMRTGCPSRASVALIVPAPNELATEGNPEMAIATGSAAAVATTMKATENIAISA